MSLDPIPSHSHIVKEENFLFLKWISIKERLPENSKKVIFLYKTDSNNREITVGCRYDNNWYHSCLVSVNIENPYSHDKVTHWMSIPEYPKD